MKNILHTISRHVALPLLLLLAAVAAGCSDPSARQRADRLNERAYAERYRSLALTRRYALEALEASRGYDAGTAESYNNLAFVCLAKMHYGKAEEFLRYAASVSDNLVEQLVADVQLMRLCQRTSHNKSFYTYMQLSRQLMARIAADEGRLNEHQRRRWVYACSEFCIVASTYFYYVGLEDKGASELLHIDPNGEVVKDTAQLLGYYYNIGSGGILRGGTAEEVCQEEFNYLMRCYLLSRQYGYPYWEANSLQALSEHLQDARMRTMLMRDNVQEMDMVNVDKMPARLIAGNLATRSLDIFGRYGDVYQTAGAYRTLAQCYFDIADYKSALICLNNALGSNPRVQRAPDLVASLREKLSLVYSALDNKRQSDYNRNIYLDLQEHTRQDRMLEARAEQLDTQAVQLNMMIGAVALAVLVLVALLVWLRHKRRRESAQTLPPEVVEPLEQWSRERQTDAQAFAGRMEEIEEQTAMTRMQLDENRMLNMEQRAKISLAGNIMPLIDRIAAETSRLAHDTDMPDGQRARRYAYVMELADKIDEYNNALTQWIKLRRGDLTVRVESFALQQVFDVIEGSRMEYALKGIDFEVAPTGAVVKADRTLTLFMINTLADNARRYTPRGGRVRVEATEGERWVEIAVRDNGAGMTEGQLGSLFSAQVIVDEQLGAEAHGTGDDAAHKSHGFGLLNCKGIIEKYKKLSTIFGVCDIGAESRAGEGSRFWFRLPKGVVRTLCVAALCLVCGSHVAGAAHRGAAGRCLERAGAFADSAYFSNIAGRYARTLDYADSCRHWLNAYYRTLHPGSRLLLTAEGDPKRAAEMQWFYGGVPCNYSIILDMRNESAVAALALHRWQVYSYNNKVYTQLFRDTSADNSLAQSVRVMQKSEASKNVAVVLLVALLVSIFPLYYFSYYRPRLRYRNAVECVGTIGSVLVGKGTARDKHDTIARLWQKGRGGDTDDPQTARLARLVEQIEGVLKDDMASDGDMRQRLGEADDELQRLRYERDRLHVSNSVLDNCLSTLKHETMYYPCRIKQLVETTGHDAGALDELVHYYRTLFCVLTEQAQRQTAAGGRMDYGMAAHVFALLKKIGGGRKLDIAARVATDARYVCIDVPLPSLTLDEKQLSELFTPLTADFRFLVCRQIMRELGETGNARACGIQAFASGDGGTRIEITLTQKIWKNLRLS